MRRCPSKGYLLAGDVNAQQDYCDHCMGWVIPLLRETGIEVLSHEHNHCGQCFGEFTVRVKPHRALSDVRDVRDDPRWRHGYIDRWEHDKKVTAHAVRLFSGPTDAGFYQLATSAALADPAAADSAQGISARAGRHNA
jgi:hypothetical protein